RVVDAETGHRRQEMLDRRDAHLALDERGREARVADVFATGANLDRARQVDAAEHDARVHGRGPQGHIDLLTRVETHVGRQNDVLERALSDHFYGVTPGAGADKTRGMLAQRFHREKLNAVWNRQFCCTKTTQLSGLARSRLTET